MILEQTYFPRSWLYYKCMQLHNNNINHFYALSRIIVHLWNNRIRAYFYLLNDDRYLTVNIPLTLKYDI